MDPVTWSFTTVDAGHDEADGDQPDPGDRGDRRGGRRRRSSAVLSEAVQPARSAVELRNAGGRRRSPARRRTTPHADGDADADARRWRPSTTYTATVSGATDAAGNTMDPLTVDLHHRGAPDTTKPTVTSRTPAAGATGVAVGTTVDGDVQRAGDRRLDELRAAQPGRHAGARHHDVRRGHADGEADADARRWPPSTTYTATVSGATDLAGNTMDPVTVDLHHRGQHQQLPVHDLADHARRRAATDPDTSPVELGVKFRAAQNGYITGIRYYKPSRHHRHPRRARCGPAPAPSWPRSTSPARPPAAGSRPPSPTRSR